ncbi:hypothetical protein J1614_008182 [Plenodomus biglobosus]|nr:hypothetical protein J1614_008182 [Plenodomus biglobosus]
MSRLPLKAIVVDARVGRLIFAHSLHKAGFDYVFLDEHAVAPASVTVHTQLALILHQLGLLDAVNKLCTEMRVSGTVVQPNGKNFLMEPFIHFGNKRYQSCFP